MFIRLGHTIVLLGLVSLISIGCSPGVVSNEDPDGANDAAEFPSFEDVDVDGGSDASTDNVGPNEESSIEDDQGTDGDPVNLAPVANNSYTHVKMDTLTNVVLSYQDPDGLGPYTVEIVEPPIHGMLAGDSINRTYTPNTGYLGQDGFRWKVSDGINDSNIAQATLRVHDPSQVPTHWYMAGANPERTSWMTDSVQNIVGIQWYRPIEAYIDQKVQIVTGNGKIYISTSKGLVVLDAENGDLKWRFDTELPLANSPSVVLDMVYVAGYDGKVYALQDLGDSYQLSWEFTEAQAGYSTNPLVVNGIVYLGSRDGFFYAIDASTGARAWRFPANDEPLSPIMLSAAWIDGVIYFAALDMFAYALNADSGALVWKSPQKLPGERYQSWWPVVFGDVVVFSAAPGYKNDSNPGTQSVIAQQNLKEIYRDTFFGTASGDSGAKLSAPDNASGWPVGTSLLDTQSNPSMPLTLDGYFSQFRHRRVFAVLNRSDGHEATTMPYIYTGTYSGNVYPPIVNPATNALYANNVLNGTGGGYVISRSTLMGWKPNNRYLHLVTNATWAIDEPLSFSGSGSNYFFSLCCDRAAGYVTGGPTYWDYGGRLLEQILPLTGPDKYDPMWQKYSNALERLNAYYNGDPRRTNGSESRNGVYANHGLQNPLVPYTFTKGQSQRVDRMFIHRSNTIIALGTTESKTFLPLVEINQNPPHVGSTYTPSQLTAKLEREIAKILDVFDANPGNGFLNPGYYNDGTNTNYISTVYFSNPGDGLWVLSLAYSRLGNATLKSRLLDYLQAFYTKYFGSIPVTQIGWTNQPRESMEFPPEVATSMAGRPDSTNGMFAARNFYALAQYAKLVPNSALSIYNAHRSRLALPSNLDSDTLVRSPYVFNDAIAGYVGFLSLQETAYNGSYPTDVAQLRINVQNELTALLAQRTQNFAKDHPWRGELDNPDGMSIHTYSRQFNLSRNFIWLTPEQGEYMRQNNLTTIQNAINEYEYLGPFWFSASVDNAFQEGVKTNLYDRPALFAAKAHIQQLSQAQLSKYIDSPTFERGDLFYIHNLAIALGAPATRLQ